MSELSYQNYDEVTHTHEIVGELKEAMIWMQSIPLEWAASDGRSFYKAIPSDAADIVDRLSRLPKHGADVLRQMMNVWSIERMTTNEGGELPFRIDRMVIGSGYLPLDASVAFDPLDPDFDQDKLRQELNRQIEDNAKTNTTSSLEVMAHLDSALFDLAPSRELAHGAWRQAQLDMTDQERRMERMAKFAFLAIPEDDKTSGPSWWSISEGHLLYTVHASSPDEAAAILDEYHENKNGSGIAPFFFIERCNEETNAAFDEALPNDEVVRLIPYSHVPWPSDFDNLTDAQREAFDRLERS